MKNIFSCSTGQNFFRLIFVVIHFWRYVDFRGRRRAQENLYFRRRWLRKFGTRFDMKQGFCEKYSTVFICYLSMKVTQHLGSSWWHAPYFIYVIIITLYLHLTRALESLLHGKHVLRWRNCDTWFVVHNHTHWVTTTFAFFVHHGLHVVGHVIKLFLNSLDLAN